MFLDHPTEGFNILQDPGGGLTLHDADQMDFVKFAQLGPQIIQVHRLTPGSCHQMEVDVGSLEHLAHPVAEEPVDAADHRVTGLSQVVDGALHGCCPRPGDGQGVLVLRHEQGAQLLLNDSSQLNEGRVKIADGRQPPGIEDTSGDLARARAQEDSLWGSELKILHAARLHRRRGYPFRGSSEGLSNATT